MKSYREIRANGSAKTLFEDCRFVTVDCEEEEFLNGPGPFMTTVIISVVCRNDRATEIMSAVEYAAGKVATP